MFDKFEIFYSNNEKAIDDLMSYLTTCYLSEQGIKVKKECLTADENNIYYFISAKRKNYLSVVDAACLYFDEHRDDENLKDLYLNNNTRKRSELMSICVMDIPTGHVPNEITLRS